MSGKRKQQWYSIKGNSKDAQKFLTEKLRELDTGSLVKPTKITVGEWLDQWLRDYRPKIARNTAQTYEFFIEKHIRSAIGQIALTDLTPAHLQRLYSSKLSSGRRDGKGGLSGRSVRYVHVTIHRALKSAVRLGVINRNVADYVDVPSIERHELKTMTEDDIHRLLEKAKETPYYALYYLAIFSGLRRSELLALHWSDVDLLLCQLSVNRTLHRLNNGELIFKEPKTQKSRRVVALSPSTCQMLQEHRGSQETERLLTGKLLQDSDLVFAQPDGKPLKPDTISHAFALMAKRLGLDGIHLHSCRHSHASLLLKKNTHPAVVMQRLGHSSITVTINTYSHVMPSLQKAAAKDFEDIILPAENQIG
jgi:integrase